MVDFGLSWNLNFKTHFITISTKIKKKKLGKNMTQILDQETEKTLSFGRTLTDGRMLEGKVALITGSNKGIGKAVAILFAQQGAKVIINGRNETDCNNIANEIQGFGGESFAAPCDVTNEAEVKQMVANIVAQYGTIDILVNNAGTSRDSLIHKTQDSELNFVIDLNLKAAHLCTQAVLPYFRQDSRRNDFKKIVNISSITGITGNFGQANYGLSKAALIAYSKACAREFARDRISVNVIAPGFTETQMTQIKKPGSAMGMPAPIRNLAISCTPFARNHTAGQPYHIASGIMFFSGPMSDWVTGQVMIIAGGMYI
jgi:3-oxoacyl-[acyl-carrier protein] reductase